MPRKSQMAASALVASEMPDGGWPEVAIMGRSNAGKSSLLNRIMGQRVALVSGNPGRTQRIHFYARDHWYLVDLPGYGYAKVPASLRLAFGHAVETYLAERQALVAAILVQDCRRDMASDEALLVNWAIQRNVLLVVAANKVDKLNRQERETRQTALETQYSCPVVMTSASSGEGLHAVKEHLSGLGLHV